MKSQNLPATTLCRTGLIIALLLSQLVSYSQESMRANLFVVAANGTKTLMDGNLTNYHNNYSNLVDWDDAWKMNNPGENFGIYRANTNLVIERRKIIGNSDTTYFRMWNMRPYNYEIMVITRNLNHPGLVGFMIDHYLNTQTVVALNDTTRISFCVNANPGSSSPLRFELVFANTLTSPVPVTFTGLKLFRKDNDVMLEFGVENEYDMANYVVEHSVNGATFSGLKVLTPGNTGIFKTYEFTDPDISKGDHFYRVKGVSLNGKIQYSPIAKINNADASMGINVYPNPVVNKKIQLQIASAISGTYKVTLLGMNGLPREMGNVQISANQSSQSLSLPNNLAPGIYRLQFAGPGNSLYIKSILVF